MQNILFKIIKKGEKRKKFYMKILFLFIVKGLHICIIHHILFYMNKKETILNKITVIVDFRSVLFVTDFVIH